MAKHQFPWPMDKPVDEIDINRVIEYASEWVLINYLLARLKKAESERDGQAWACHALWDMPDGGESASEKAEYKKAMEVMSRGWNYRNEPKE